MQRKWIEQINDLTIYFESQTQYFIYDKYEHLLAKNLTLAEAEAYCKNHVPVKYF